MRTALHTVLVACLLSLPVIAADPPVPDDAFVPDLSKYDEATLRAICTQLYRKVAALEAENKRLREDAKRLEQQARGFRAAGIEARERPAPVREAAAADYLVPGVAIPKAPDIDEARRRLMELRRKGMNSQADVLEPQIKRMQQAMQPLRKLERRAVGRLPALRWTYDNGTWRTDHLGESLYVRGSDVPWINPEASGQMIDLQVPIMVINPAVSGQPWSVRMADYD